MEHSGLSLFAGVGERTREGNDLYGEMQDSSIIAFHFKDLKADGSHESLVEASFVHDPWFAAEKSQVVLVFGQMNETASLAIKSGIALVFGIDTRYKVLWPRKVE